MSEGGGPVVAPVAPVNPLVENGDIVSKSSAVNGSSKHKEHKSEHSDKHRDRDKDRHRSDRDKDKYKHSSSSKSSHKDKDRDKDRDRHKDEKRSHDKDKDKNHRSSSHSSSKDKERSRDKDHHLSSSSKDKHSSSSSRDKDKEKHRDKDGERHSSSHKDKYSSSKDKERHSSSKDKEKHSSSSSKDKDRHRDKSKSSYSDIKSNGNKEKEREISREEVIQCGPAAEKEIEFNKSNIKTENDMDDTAVDESMDVDVKVEVKEEEEEDEEEVDAEVDDDEVPLSLRGVKREVEEEEDEEDTPLFARAKKIKRRDDSDEDDYKPKKKTKKRVKEESDEEENYKPKNKTQKPVRKGASQESPRKVKKEEDQQEVWKWWEEEKKDDGTKWKFLQHRGPLFAPDYEPLPHNVKFYYDGKEVRLNEQAEEVATFYAKMLNHDYTNKEAFNTNFFKDWRKTMTEKEKSTIKHLEKCNFKDMHAYFEEKSAERKAMSKEEKKKIKEQNDEITKEYGFCKIDGHTEKIGNFRVEPPGLFRGRGEHPKMGMHKYRVQPEDVSINCSKDSVIPKPPSGHKWKKVQHDPSVTWLASWTENVQGNVKYVMLNPSSKLKGEKDWMKYETARKLAKKINKIRDTYQEDWKSKEMRIRQRAVALYFIDRLALRAGNEKDEDQADTVGCCSLRVEHVSLEDELNGKENVVVFDFPGKDSIRYYNEVPVHKRVYKNLKLFMDNKKAGDDLFDRLNTTVLNKHLNELMDGLTAKVFRTYNASFTLQNQLNELTNPDDTVPEKVLAYNRANRAVAILCNHQRSVPKTHEKSMGNLKAKIDTKKETIQEAKDEYKACKRRGDATGEAKAKKKLERLKEQLMKLELEETNREENKTIALGTSKLNYLDPRISVAWCKKYDVPIEKIYNKTQRDKFRWAIDMAGPDYVF